jgi:glucose/mannose transport system substrate-binding protein
LGLLVNVNVSHIVRMLGLFHVFNIGNIMNVQLNFLVFLLVLLSPLSKAEEIIHSTSSMPTLSPKVSSLKTKFEVLHWWTSDSERLAMQVLKDEFNHSELAWQDAGIDGGAGQGAVKVLKSMILAGKAPDAAQIIGYSIQDWAKLGFLASLNQTANEEQWSESLPQALQQHIRYRNDFVAVPFAVHQINNLYFNVELFERYKLSAPNSWLDLINHAQILKNNGHIAIAHSSQPWQVMTLFESLILSVADVDYYQRLFVQLDPQAFDDPVFIQALQRLKQLQSFMDEDYHNRPWVDASQLMASGQAGMQFMGDWAKAELQSMGQILDRDFGCAIMPGTRNKHLYSMDSFSMFSNSVIEKDSANQVASMIMKPDLQLEFSRMKGTFPARSDINIMGLDHCAQSSKATFSEGNLAPSLTHRMANSEGVINLFMAEIHHFFVNDHILATDVQMTLKNSVQALK